jgi:hypothetical protein
MMRSRWIAALSVLAAAAPATELSAASLRGSPAAMVEQNSMARQHGLTFHRTPQQIRASVERGDLVELTGNLHYAVADFVSFPYLQPAAHLFVERLAAQYYSACGQQLVVTSAVRPASRQPSNAHRLSVHPAGMAVDLRVSDRASCRSWLESALLGMESRGLINGIREFRPPHYHVAVYPGPYLTFAQDRIAEEERAAAAAAREATAVQTALGGLREMSAEVGSAFLPGEATETDAAAARPGRLLVAAALALLVMVPARIRSRLRGDDR